MDINYNEYYIIGVAILSKNLVVMLGNFMSLISSSKITKFKDRIRKFGR